MSSDPPVGHPRLVKLVRDRVGDLLTDSTVAYEIIADRAQFIAQLREKPIEESVEYLKAPSIGELADIVEACMALAKCDLDVPWEAVEAVRVAKREERGSFEHGMGMYVRSSATPEHEGEHVYAPSEAITGYELMVRMGNDERWAASALRSILTTLPVEMLEGFCVLPALKALEGATIDEALRSKFVRVVTHYEGMAMALGVNLRDREAMTKFLADSAARTARGSYAQ